MARIGIVSIVALAAVISIVPVSAGATVIVWTLHDVDFGSADPVSGSVTIDTIKGVKAIDLTTGFGSFTSLSDVQGGNPLDLKSGPGFFDEDLLLQAQFGLNTNVPSQLADNPLFGGSDDIGFTELTLNTKDGPFISGAIAAAAPEPSTWALLLMGVASLGAWLRRRLKHVAIGLQA